MTALFDFQKAYGKLGSWPGTIGPGPAQQIYLVASQCAPGSKFVEVGFDGGRTTIALNWAASTLNARIVSVLGPAAPIWFQRVAALHRMQGRASLERVIPNDGDLYVYNAQSPITPEHVAEIKPDATIVKIGGTDLHDERLTVISQSPEVTIWKRTGVDKITDAAIERVVADMSEKVVPLDTHRGPDRETRVHSGVKAHKRHGHGRSADSEIHAVVDADQGSELRQDKGLET